MDGVVDTAAPAKRRATGKRPAERPRYVLFRPDPAAREEALADAGPAHALSELYVRGRMEQTSRRKTFPATEAGDVVFDLADAVIHVDAGAAGKDMVTPCVACPDCSGRLLLKPKPERWRASGGKWHYECENEGCDAHCGARADGTLLGVPGDAATRRARKLTHEVFDRLWREAPAASALPQGSPERYKAEQKARAQAYRWFAHAMEISGGECLIAAFDIPTLRRAFRICRDAAPAEVAAFEPPSKDGAAPESEEVPIDPFAP